MKLPWVSRARFDDARQQIADLKEANAKLLELMGLKQAIPAAAEPDEAPTPSKPYRKLGSELRAEFRQAAEERKQQLGTVK